MQHLSITLPHQFNFAHHLLELNAGRAGKAAYIDDHEELSYGELDRRVRSFAAALLDAGIHREQRVLLIMHDTVDLPVAMLGAMFAGIIPVPVNTLLPAEDYAYMIEHSRARAVIVSAPLLASVREALTKTANRPELIVSGGQEPDLRSMRAMQDAAPLAHDAYAATCADDFAFWLYSSGSTGRPKGTVHSH